MDISGRIRSLRREMADEILIYTSCLPMISTRANTWETILRRGNL